MLRRRPVLILIVMLFAYAGAQMWDIYRVGHLERERKADCAIVLGAAAWHNKPSPVLRERLNHAIALFKKGAVSSLLLTGGYGKGADFAESEVGLDYCVKNGIPASAIRAERESLSTIDNLKKAREIMDEEKWQDAILVSDPWHLKRARRMADDLGIEVYVSATRSSRFRSFASRAKFLLGEFLLYHHYLLTGE